MKSGRKNSRRSEARKTSVRRILLATGAAIIAPSTAAFAQLDEVVVTARKTEESLQQVPVSVASATGAELEKRSIADLSDLAEATPNITFGQQAQGGRIGGLVFIRGVGQRDSLAVYDPAVGVYIDGVYLGRMNANDLDMLEIERVEVLRGPQGTLFGKNTSGGAVNIVTKRPDTSADAFGGRVMATTGSRDRFDIQGSVNVPLVADTLAFQLSGSRRTQDGYGHRLTDGDDMGDTHRSSLRGQLLFTPTDNFSATLSGDWTTIDEKNASFNLTGVNTNIPPVQALNFFTTETYDERWLSPGPYEYYGGGPNSSRGELWGGSLTLDLDMGWAQLKSISAYREVSIHNDEDPDGSPVNILDQYQQVDQHQVSQELQLTGDSFDNRLNWVLGAYYFHEEAHDNIDYALLTALFGTAVSFSQDNMVENNSYAVFGQGSYNITDKLRLTAGLRYTNDEKIVDFAHYSFPDDVQLLPLLTGKHSSESFSPRVGLDYQWTPDVMTYFSVAQGAKNGGYNGRANAVTDFTEFEDEYVWTYEAGIRTEFLDGVGRFNATGFYSKYKDLQIQITGSTLVGGAPQPFNVITNVPKANIKGGEAELVLAPMEGFLFNAALGLTFAEYTELPTDPTFVASGVINLDSKFMNAPEATFAAGAEYTHDLSSSLEATLRVDYSYRSKIYYNVENTAPLVQDKYGLLNARLSFLHEPSGLTVSVFGTNLTDEYYITGGFDDASTPNPALGFTVVNEGRPREWGVSVQKSF
ncbi:MAG: TonB-dependent receptor [Parvularculaceae bacterium]